MEKRIWVLASCSSILVLCVALLARGDAKHAQEQAVVAAVAKLMDAGLTRDVARLAQLYDKDYFHTNPDGTVWRLPAVLASYRTPPAVPVESQSREDDVVLLIGGSTAVVNSRVILRGHVDGKSWERVYRTTWILTRRSGAWRVINSHASQVLH